MLARATITVDLKKISDNARAIATAIAPIEIIGVTKVTCGSPQVARAMLAGGATGLADSRLENIARMRDAGIPGPFWLLRASTPALAEETVRLADVSLESEIDTIEELDEAAMHQGVRHGVVVMIDLGDLREGVMPADVPALLECTKAFGSVEVVGIGASLTCYGAIVPSEENMLELVRVVEAAEKQLGRRLLVSGGMSSSIEMSAAGQMPPRIDNLRIGESMLLGVSTVTREPILGLHTDAITLSVPVIECLRKPSLPCGVCAQDAFGTTPCFEDRGERMRAIGAIGRQDAPPEGLRPLDPRVEVLGASSDHLILDVDALPEPPRVGESVEFVPNYAATLQLFTSQYVDKRYVDAWPVPD